MNSNKGKRFFLGFFIYNILHCNKARLSLFWGAGFIYLFCNLPFIQAAPPPGQSAILELVAEPLGAGSVIGSGTYGQGRVVSIQAAPSQYYTFSRWQGPVVNPSASTTDVYIGKEKQRIIAIFEPIRHMVSVKIEPLGAGTVGGAGYQEAGKPVALLAEPAKGYEFDYWEGDVSDKTAPSAKMSTPLIGAVNLTAHFKQAFPIYKLDIVCAPEKGGRVTGAGSYKRASSATIEAIPARSYIFNGWEGAPVGFAGDAKTTVFISGNITLKAKFLLNRSRISASVSPADGGRVRGGNDYYPVDAPLEVIAEPAEGYKFVRWEGPVANPTKEQTTVTPVSGRETKITAIFTVVR